MRQPQLCYVPSDRAAPGLSVAQTHTERTSDASTPMGSVLEVRVYQLIEAIEVVAIPIFTFGHPCLEVKVKRGLDACP